MAKPTYPVSFLRTIFLMSVAACAAALGSFEDTVWGVFWPPFGIELLVFTKGDAGLPFGTWADGLGMGEARLEVEGGEVGAEPFAVAGLELVLDDVTRT